MYTAYVTSSCFLSTASNVCVSLLAFMQNIVRSYKHMEHAVVKQEAGKQYDRYAAYYNIVKVIKLLLEGLRSKNEARET